MRQLTIEQGALLAQVSEAWQAYKAERAGAEARIRALVSADVAKSIDAARQAVTATLGVALSAKVPRKALKEVTTKDGPSFAGLLPPREPPALTTVDVSGPMEGFECSWDGEELRLRLEPTMMPGSEYDPSEPRHWTAILEHFVRPSDGRVFLDPPTNWRFSDGIAVLTWLRTESNKAKVVDWCKANPRHQSVVA